MIKKIIDWYSRDLIKRTIGLVLLIVATTIFIHARFNKPEGVVIWDIKSYYSYLPATFIYQDLTLDFMDKEPGKFSNRIWPIETPTGKKAITTTYGMAVLYTPFFLLGHMVALVVPAWEADGYSWPYYFALNFSALFYLWIGLLFLSKVLSRFFREKIVAFTIFAVVIGTNLFYYTTAEAPMTHAFSFALFAVFLWRTIKFYDHPTLKNILISGALAGFITLIRPTNIIILLIFFLWDIKSWANFKERFIFFLQRFHWVIFMALIFVLVWVPQFTYWYHVSGKVFYFTYGEKGASFFFNNPQIFNILFSYKKGWLVYTPLMIFALTGIFMLPKKVPGAFLSLFVFTILNIYILSSWWSWWFGGAFGLRAFIESYALLALPLAGFVDFASKRTQWVKQAVLAFLVLLIAFNQFQTRQYNNNAIHWWWMNKEAYWETFLKLRPTDRFWVVVTLPDYEAARKGIYRELKSSRLLRLEAQAREWTSWKQPIPEEKIIDWLTEKYINDSIQKQEMITDILDSNSDTLSVARELALEAFNEKGFKYWEREMGIELVVEEISLKPGLMKEIERKAKENNLPVDTQLVYDAKWLFKHSRDF